MTKTYISICYFPSFFYKKEKKYSPSSSLVDPGLATKNGSEGMDPSSCQFFAVFVSKSIWKSSIIRCCKKKMSYCQASWIWYIQTIENLRCRPIGHLSDCVGKVARTLCPTSVSISIVFTQVSWVNAAHIHPSPMLVWVQSCF